MKKTTIGIKQIVLVCFFMLSPFFLLPEVVSRDDNRIWDRSRDDFENIWAARTDTLLTDTLPADSLHTDTLPFLHPLRWDNVHQDEKISMLLHAHRNAVSRQQGVPGYRVHLYMDSGNRARLNTQREQAAFEKKYPDVRAYIVYEEPYFKLRVGDFRTRLDARRFLEKIRRDYSAAYIVVDMINFPEMD
ncbi:MAG: SPOR domain-containing protein [Bacteroidia bacterium]|nr:MAG: SPOR domain-containing protein [Bacteroidia bacterium]